MRELIAAVVSLGFLLYLMRNETAPIRKREMFEPEIIQNTINSIQEKEPDVYPINTVYFNKSSDGTVYDGRFMFLNTKDFYGVQYDVKTDGSKIVSLTRTIPPEYQNPFSGYETKQLFSEMKPVAPFVDMQKIHENFKVKVN
jgi:hypothetical protein